MARPLQAPSFYDTFITEGQWHLRGDSLSVPYHLDFAARCQNSYNPSGYRQIIYHARWAEAVDVIDAAYGLAGIYASDPGTARDPRHTDAAWRVGRWMYYDTGGVGSYNECQRPGSADNPNGIRDPVAWLYDRGWWDPRSPEAIAGGATTESGPRQPGGTAAPPPSEPPPGGTPPPGEPPPGGAPLPRVSTGMLVLAGAVVAAAVWLGRR